MKKIVIIGISVFIIICTVLIIKTNNTYKPADEILIPKNKSYEYSGLDITVKGSRIINGNDISNLSSEYEHMKNEDGTTMSPDDEKALIVDLHIEKKDKDTHLDFTQIYAESGSWCNGIDIELMTELNKDGLDFSNDEDGIIDISFAYNLYKMHFTKDAWNKIEERPFYLTFQLFPQKIVYDCSIR